MNVLLALEWGCKNREARNILSSKQFKRERLQLGSHRFDMGERIDAGILARTTARTRGGRGPIP